MAGCALEGAVVSTDRQRGYVRALAEMGAAAHERFASSGPRAPLVNVNPSWDCGGDPGPRKGYTEDRMYSTERRRLAIETFIRFGHSYADTIAELGYPDRHTLNSWWREYRETGEVPVGKMIREPRFSDDQKRVCFVK